MQHLHMHNVVLHERSVNGWGKVWCVTLYLIRALGLNNMEARFRHWLKNRKGYRDFFLSQLWLSFSELLVYISQLLLLYAAQRISYLHRVYT